MTQLLIDRATLEQLVDCPASDYERMYALKKQLRAALGNAKRVEPDTQRLDFMFLYDAFLSRTKTDADTIAYQLLAQDDDEDYVVLSGEDKFFPTGRAAVDAAREKAKP